MGGWRGQKIHAFCLWQSLPRFPLTQQAVSWCIPQPQCFDAFPCFAFRLLLVHLLSRGHCPLPGSSHFCCDLLCFGFVCPPFDSIVPLKRTTGTRGTGTVLLERRLCRGPCEKVSIVGYGGTKRGTTSGLVVPGCDLWFRRVVICAAALASS